MIRLIFVLMTVGVVSAAQDDKDPIEKCLARYQLLLTRNQTKLLDGLKSLKTAYSRAIKNEMTKSQKAGKLEQYMSLKKRLEAIEAMTGLTIDESDLLAKTYRRKIDDLAKRKLKDDVKTTEAYLRYLKGKKSSETKAGRIEMALKYKAEEERVKVLLPDLIAKIPKTLHEPTKPADQVVEQKEIQWPNGTTGGEKIHRDPTYGAAKLTNGKMPSSSKCLSLGGAGVLELNLPEDALDGEEATYALWVRPSESQTSRGWCEIMFDGNRKPKMDRAIQLVRGKVKAHVWFPPANVQIMSEDRAPVEKWVHLALVVRKAQVSLYVGGKLAAEYEGNVPGHDESSEIILGARKIGGRFQHHYVGMITCLGVWKRPLTLSEVRNHMHGKIANKDLLGYWDFTKGLKPTYGRFREATPHGDAKIVPVEK